MCVLVVKAYSLLTFRNRMVLIMKLASCSSFSTVTPTPLYSSSRSRPAGQYCTHITRMKSNVLWVKVNQTEDFLLSPIFQIPESNKFFPRLINRKEVGASCRNIFLIPHPQGLQGLEPVQPQPMGLMPHPRFSPGSGNRRRKSSAALCLSPRNSWQDILRTWALNCEIAPGDHDDARGPLLPHHAPEVADRRLRRALRHYVGLRLRQTLREEHFRFPCPQTS